MRRHSQLVFRRVPPRTQTTRAIVVALHGAEGGLDDLVPLVRTLGDDVAIVAPEAARAVYRGMDVIAHTWYGATEANTPEPVSFGDSLAQVERFVVDEAARASGSRLVLLGYDQGATLALALAEVVPEHLAGVIAIGGASPNIGGWTPPVAELNWLPILIVTEPNDYEGAMAVASQLRVGGAAVTVERVAGAYTMGDSLGARLRQWLAFSVTLPSDHHETPR